ncbi:MAG: hypothetical protein GIKADHBN_00588 [Phycisphaerales bacterium]|nr:hypothetical protein [Phycisphaerales bacterium]MCK6475899.1 hypothetical protein [Phycisphaerales bacterium]
MNMRRTVVLGFAGTAAIAAAASAATVNAVVTADNHYALYSSTGSTFFYHGGNELGAGGSPGTYNWSQAESYTFNAGDYLYIAAWSDDSVAQGVLANIWVDGNPLHSGDPAWQVYASGLVRGDGDPHPDASEVGGHVATATTNNLWEAPHVGGANGLSPWGTIAGINGDARWMWYATPGDDDPLQGGSGAGELLIFRTEVPAPGAAALAGLGGLLIGRRRR